MKIKEENEKVVIKPWILLKMYKQEKSTPILENRLYNKCKIHRLH